MVKPRNLTEGDESLSALFNKFYNGNRIIDENVVSASRLKLVELVKDKLATGLKLLGISAPTTM